MMYIYADVSLGLLVAWEAESRLSVLFWLYLAFSGGCLLARPVPGMGRPLSPLFCEDTMLFQPTYSLNHALHS
jgi:hypothetical protein